MKRLLGMFVISTLPVLLSSCGDGRTASETDGWSPQEWSDLNEDGLALAASSQKSIQTQLNERDKELSNQAFQIALKKNNSCS